MTGSSSGTRGRLQVLTAAAPLLTTAALLLGAAFGAGAVRAAPPGSAFTFHGRFTEGGELPTGTFDLRFELFSEATPAGSLGTFCLDDVEVENGLLDVEIDFGVDVFASERRWLGIQARRDGGATCDTDLSSYVPMVDALELLPTAESVFAVKAGSLLNDAVMDADSDPTNELNQTFVLDGGTTLQLTDAGGALAQSLAPLNIHDRYSLDAHDGDPVDALYVDDDGDVGIGTTSGATALDVRGDVSLNGHDLRLRSGLDGENGLGWYGVGKPFGLSTPDGPVLYGRSGGGLGITQSAPTEIAPGNFVELPPPREALSWREHGGDEGAVGVDRTDPQATLDVGGTLGDVFRVDGSSGKILRALGSGGIGIGRDGALPDSLTALSVRAQDQEDFLFPFRVATADGSLAFGVTGGQGVEARKSMLAASDLTVEDAAMARQSMSVAGDLTAADPANPSSPKVQIGGTDPYFGRLYVEGNVEGPENQSSSYIAHFHNTNTGCCPDVLDLQVDHVDDSTIPNLEATNFIQFVANGQVRGTVQLTDDDSGFGVAPGVSYETYGSDFAELVPMLDPQEELGPGDVVGVFGGRISRRTEGASWVMAVSTNPGFVGNRSSDPAREALRKEVAFVGQVHVRTIGPVRRGDYVVASGREDGTAVAVSPLEIRPRDATRIVGRAWEDSDETGEHRVRIIVGLPESGSTVRGLLAELDQIRRQRDRRLAALKERIARLEATLEANLETNLETGSETSAAPGPRAH